MKELGIHDRLAARVDQLVGIHKYKELRAEIIKEENIDNDIAIDNCMMLSLAIIYKDQLLLDLFTEKCEEYRCCEDLFENRQLTFEKISPEMVGFLKGIHDKINERIAIGYFNSVKKN